MKKLKVLMSVLLTAILILTAAGCGGSKEAGTSATATEATKTTESSAAEEKKLENPNLLVMNLGPTGLNEAEGAGADTKKWYEETYGGKVTEQIVGWAEIETKLLVMASAGQGPDLAMNTDLYIPRLLVRDIYQPMDEYIDLSDPIFKLDVMDAISWKGKHYVAYWAGSLAPWMTLYNQDMFEANGLKTPLEYYKEGAWTYENFAKVAKELTQDTDKDGNIDQWGCNYYAVDTFVLQSGGAFVDYNDDGTISVKWNSPEVLEGIQFLQDGIKDKYFSGAPNYNGDFLNGKSAMFVDAIPIDFMNMGYTGNGGKFKMGFAPFPTGPRAEKDRIAVTVPGYGMGTGCANPEGAGIFLTQWYKNMKDYADGTKKPSKPTELEGNYAFSQEQKDFYMEVVYNSKAYIPLWAGVPWDWGLMNFLGDIGAFVPPATIIEKYTAPLQALLDKLVKEAAPVVEKFTAPAPEDFESGTAGIMTSSDVAPVKAEVTKDAAEIIAGTTSLKIEAPAAGGFVIRTDETKLKLPSFHIYRISFDYKVIKAPAEGGNFSVWIFPKANLADWGKYYAGMWVNTMPAMKDGDTGTFTVDITIDSETKDNVVAFNNAGGGTIVIDNFKIVEAE